MSNDGRTQPLYLWAYVLTLLALLLSDLFPHARLWGFAYWSFWPAPVRVFLFVACAVGGVVLYRSLSKPAPGTRKSKAGPVASRLSTSWILGLAAAHLIVFFLWRAQTYFLGDGYLRLNQLAYGTPLHQLHNLAETFLEFGIRRLVPLSAPLAAMVTYRLLSFAAGVAFIVVMAWSARRIFALRVQQLLWTLITVSGGYGLLFFGYVENYSMFCLSVGIFIAVGLLAASDYISSWWIVPAWLVAVAFHGAGIALAPAALYLVLSRTGIDAWLRETGRKIRLAVALGLLACAAAVLYRLALDSLFIRYALVPLRNGLHSVEGYTLFSVAHLLDIANLVIVLIPGVLVLLVLRARVRNEKSEPAGLRARGFLLAAAVGPLAAVFLLEAKLGVPRDWDLFSFVGVPLLAFLAFPAVQAAGRSRSMRAGLALVVVLGYVGLLSRAAVLATPKAGVEQFKRFARLDMKKNRAAWYTLREYYERAGDRAGLEEVLRVRMANYPEEQWTIRAGHLLAQDSVEQAARFAGEAIRINPMYSMSWLQLGKALLAAGKPDSALDVLKTADALNPHSRFVLKELGRAYSSVGHTEDAEKCWLETARLDPNDYETAVLLSHLYRGRGDRDRYAQYLQDAANQPDADGALFKELGDLKLAAGDDEAALQAYRQAIAKGVAPSAIEAALEAHPELQERLQTADQRTP